MKTAGLDPAIFKVEESELTTAIHVVSPPLVFEARHSPSSFTDLTYRYKGFAPNWPYVRPTRPTNYSQLSTARKQGVDFDMNEGWQPAGEWCTFQEVADAFARWLVHHVTPALANAAAPDLWAQAGEALPSFDDVPQQEQEAFDAAEAARLRDALRLFGDLIKVEFKPDDEQFREVVTRLEYLSDAVDRLNKFDWRALALSTVIGVGTTLAVDTESGRQLWALFHQALRSAGHLLGS